MNLDAAPQKHSQLLLDRLVGRQNGACLPAYPEFNRTQSAAYKTAGRTPPISSILGSGVQGVPASRRPADSPAEPASPSTVSPGHHRSAATGSVTGQRASGRVVGGVVHGEPALDGGLDRPGLEQRRPLPRNCPRVQGEPREVHDFLSPAQYG